MACLAAAGQVSAAGAPEFYDTPFYGLVKQIADCNPIDLSAHARSMAEAESVRAENIPENPEVEFERLWSAGPADSKWSGGISQSFDWPGAYRARSRAAGKIELAQRESFLVTYKELSLRVAQLAVDVIAANRRIQILEEMNRAMTALREKYDRAWEHGETTILDLNKIKIEEIRSAAELEQAVMDRDALVAELTALGQTPAVDELIATTDFPMLAPLRERDYYVGEAVANSPEARYNSLMADAEAENIKVAEMQRFPGFKVGYVHAFEEGTHFNGISVGLSLPVYSRKHAVNAARYMEAAARFESAAVRISLESKAGADYDSAVRLHDLMTRYAPLVEGTNNLLLLKKALDGGELSLLDYLQEVNYFLAARTDYLTLTRDYLQTCLRLEMLAFPSDGIL